MSNEEKAELLMELEGIDDSDLEMLVIDSVVPGICVNPDCDYTCEVEPDQTAGWCEECQQGSVQSLLILLGVI